MLSRYPRRRNRRYTRAVKPIKYSSETYNFSQSYNITSGQGLSTNKIALIPDTTVQGMRKVKNFTLTICCNTQVPLMYALVYVPQGIDASALNLGTAEEPASLYEPNQNVIISGVIPVNLSVPIVKYSPLARNLNSGDQVFLCLRSAFNFGDTASIDFYCSLNYAITY